MKKYIAEKYSKGSANISLNTAALEKYKDIIDLSIGDTDLITDKRIIDRAFQDAKRGYTRYGNPKGDPELISSFCNFWYEDFGQKLSADNLLVTASSCLGMSLVMLSLLNPGDEVIVFSPYFPMYKGQIELAGGVCVEVPCYAEEGWAISADRIRDAITSKTKAFIFNNPTNPSGMSYGKNTLEILAEIAREYDLIAVSDEIYTTYMFEEEFVPLRTLPGMEDRTVTLNSFSKNFMMTGWRVGTIVAHPDFINVMNSINGSLIYTAPSISQRAGIEALEIRKDVRDKYISVYEDRVLFMADELAKIDWIDLVRPKGTFYIFPGIEKTGMSSVGFCDYLLENAHILVTPGKPFGCTGEGHFRIACTVPREQLAAAVNRMKELSF